MLLSRQCALQVFGAALVRGSRQIWGYCTLVRYPLYHLQDFDTIRSVDTPDVQRIII